MSSNPVSGDSTSPVPDARSYAAVIARAEELVQKELADKVPGCSVTVAVDNTVVWSQGFGYSDLTLKRPVTAKTRFRIGSVSKPITAAGLVLLVEQGLLDLDLPIQHYLPDYPNKGAVITTRMLAGHLSGIRNYQGSEAATIIPVPKQRLDLIIFEDDPLLFPPGEKYSYTSYNYSVIGAIMEAVTKQDFLAYIDEHVIRPLGLANTVPNHWHAVDPQRSQFYETDVAGGFLPAPKAFNSRWPAGGYLSTTDDMARFGCAHLHAKFLKPESRKLLFTPQKTNDGKLVPYGVGWQLSPGHAIAYHGGNSFGGGAILALFPGAKTVVAVACNRGHLAIEKKGEKYQRAEMPPGMALNFVKIGISIAKLFR